MPSNFSILARFFGALARPMGFSEGIEFGEAAILGCSTTGLTSRASKFNYITEAYTDGANFLFNVGRKAAARLHPWVYWLGGNDGITRNFVQRYNALTDVVENRTALAAVTESGAGSGAWSDGQDRIMYTQSSGTQSARTYFASTGVTGSATALSSARVQCSMTGNAQVSFIRGGNIGLLAIDASENYTFATGTLVAGTLYGLARTQLGARSNGISTAYFCGGFDPGSGSEFQECRKFSIPGDVRTNLTNLSVAMSGPYSVGTVNTAFFIWGTRALNRYTFATDARTVGAAAPNVTNAEGGA